MIVRGVGNVSDQGGESRFLGRNLIDELEGEAGPRRIRMLGHEGVGAHRHHGFMRQPRAAGGHVCEEHLADLADVSLPCGAASLAQRLPPGAFRLHAAFGKLDRRDGDAVLFQRAGPILVHHHRAKRSDVADAWREDPVGLGRDPVAGGAGHVGIDPDRLAASALTRLAHELRQGRQTAAHDTSWGVQPQKDAANPRIGQRLAHGDQQRVIAMPDHAAELVTALDEGRVAADQRHAILQRPAKASVFHIAEPARGVRQLLFQRDWRSAFTAVIFHGVDAGALAAVRQPNPAKEGADP